MQLTARNILKGQVTSVELGQINAEVTLELADGVAITAIISRKAGETQRLRVGSLTKKETEFFSDTTCFLVAALF